VVSGAYVGQVNLLPACLPIVEESYVGNVGQVRV